MKNLVSLELGPRGRAFVVASALLLATISSQDAQATGLLLDDARIVDRGQVSSETVLATSTAEFSPLLGTALGVSPTHWLELNLGAGSGLGSDRAFTLANPWGQLKVLFLRPEDGAYPGLALNLGMIFPVGFGEFFFEATGYFATAVSTMSILDGAIEFHANLGLAAESAPGEDFHARLAWGVGADVVLGSLPLAVALSALSGAPTDAEGPPLAGQLGLMWFVSDAVTLDGAVYFAPGREEEVDDGGFSRVLEADAEWVMMLGLTVVFDVFTTDGEPGDPEGGRGLFGSK